MAAEGRVLKVGISLFVPWRLLTTTSGKGELLKKKRDKSKGISSEHMDLSLSLALFTCMWAGKGSIKAELLKVLGYIKNYAFS